MASVGLDVGINNPIGVNDRNEVMTLLSDSDTQNRFKSIIDALPQDMRARIVSNPI